MKTLLVYYYLVWAFSLCNQLGHDNFRYREKAGVRLEAAGPVALPARVVGSLWWPDCEVRSRLGRGTAGELADWLRALWALLSPEWPTDSSPGVLIKMTALSVWLGVQDPDFAIGNDRDSYFIGLMIGRARVRIQHPWNWGKCRGSWYPYPSRDWTDD